MYFSSRNAASQFPGANVNPQGMPWGNSVPGADAQQVAAYLGRYGYAPASLYEGPYTDAPRSTMAFGASTNPYGGNPLIVDLPRSDSASLYYRTTALFADGVHGDILSPSGIVPIRQTSGSAFRTSEMRTLPSLPVPYAYRGPTRDVQMVQSSRVTTLTHWAMGFDFLADLLNAPDGPWKLRLSLAQQNISALDSFVMIALNGLMNLKDLMAESWRHRLSQWQQEEGVDAFEFLSNENRFVGALQSSQRPLEPLMQEILESQSLYEESGSDTLIVGREIGHFVQGLTAYTKYFIAGPPAVERLSAYASGGVLAAAALPMRVISVKPKMVKGYGTFNMMQSMIQTGDFIPFEDLSARNIGAKYSTSQRTVFAYNGAADTMEEIPFSAVIANCGRFDVKTDYLQQFTGMKPTDLDSFYTIIDGKQALHRFFGQQRIEHMPHETTLRIADVLAQNRLGTVTPSEFEQALEVLRSKALSIGQYEITDEFFAYVGAFAAKNAGVLQSPAEDGALTMNATAALSLPENLGATLSTPLPPAMGNSVGLWLIHKAAQTSTADAFPARYGFSFEAAMEISRAYTIVMRAQGSLQNVFGQSGAGGQSAQALNVVSTNSMHAFLDMVIGSGIPLWTSTIALRPQAGGNARGGSAAGGSGSPQRAATGAANRFIFGDDQRIQSSNTSALELSDGDFVAQTFGRLQYAPIGVDITSALGTLPANEANSKVPQEIILPEKTTAFSKFLQTAPSQGTLIGVVPGAPEFVAAVLALYFNAYPTSAQQGANFTSVAAYKLEYIRYYALATIAAIYKAYTNNQEAANPLVLDFVTNPASPVKKIADLVPRNVGGVNIDDAQTRATIDEVYNALFAWANTEQTNPSLFAVWGSANLSGSQTIASAIARAEGRAVQFVQNAAKRVLTGGNSTLAANAPTLRNPGAVPAAATVGNRQTAAKSRIGQSIVPTDSVRLPLNISAAQFEVFPMEREISPADPVAFARIASAQDKAGYVAMLSRPTPATPGSLLVGDTTYRQLPSFVAASQILGAGVPNTTALSAGPAVNVRDKLMAYVINRDANAQAQLDAVAKLPSVAQRALAYMFLLCPIRLSVITSMLSGNVPIPFTGFAMRCYIQFETSGIIACKRGAQNVVLKDEIFTWGQHPQQQSFMGTLSYKVGFVGLDEGVWKIQHALLTSVRPGGFDLSIITGGDYGSAAMSSAELQPIDNNSYGSASNVARGSVMMLLEPQVNRVGENNSGTTSVDSTVLALTGTYEHLGRISGGNIKNTSDRTLFNSAFHLWWFRVKPVTTSLAVTEGNAEQAASTPPNRFIGYRGLYETINADGTRTAGKPPTGVFPASVYKVGITTAIRNRTSFAQNNTVDVW